MSVARVFPFEPKTTVHVEPGDFWAIPTRRGGWFCCGRVLALHRDLAQGARTSLDIGLLDWCEPELPTPETIAGAVVTDFGGAHVKTIRETGRQLLGHRPLEADGGLAALVEGRKASGVWGYKSIEDLAHARFGRHFPAEPALASDRPAPLLRPWDDRD